MRYRARDSGGKFALFAPGLHVVPPYWFIVRQDTGRDFATSSDSKISGFTRPHVIGFVADLFFSTLVSAFKNIRIRCGIRRIRVDGSRIYTYIFFDLHCRYFAVRSYQWLTTHFKTKSPGQWQWLIKCLEQTSINWTHLCLDWSARLILAGWVIFFVNCIRLMVRECKNERTIISCKRSLH